MAIDLMVMPLSRYFSGDYITPMMREMWEQGLPYKIVGPEGVKACPPGLPMGGEGAAAHRESIQEDLSQDLRALPEPISSKLWDERSEVPPRIHRIDHVSFGKLLELAPGKKGLLGIGGKRPIPELHATLFFPQDFEGVLDLELPMQAQAASAPRLLAKLVAATIPAEAEEASAVLGEALRDCIELGFPMIVDM
jgi:hypothetical protein